MTRVIFIQFLILFDFFKRSSNPKDYQIDSVHKNLTLFGVLFLKPCFEFFAYIVTNQNFMSHVFKRCSGFSLKKEIFFPGGKNFFSGVAIQKWFVSGHMGRFQKTLTKI